MFIDESAEKIYEILESERKLSYIQGAKAFYMHIKNQAFIGDPLKGIVELELDMFIDELKKSGYTC
ncbi:MAG: hypothetical protein GY760_29140 [Deltaproteobacteria bacterium]|nr:hypothetical protein [Deltaproteobacteria bacterium]